MGEKKHWRGPIKEEIQINGGDCKCEWVGIVMQSQREKKR